MMKVRFGQCQMEYPSAELGELRDANALLGDTAALRQRIEEDGYLLFRALIDRDKVLKAREAILRYMAEHEGLEPGSRPLDGVMGQYGKGVGMMGRRAITHHPDVNAVLEGPELVAFFQEFFDGPIRGFDYKWLRAVGHEQFTGCHYDVVYMGRGSPNLHTCWVPFADVPIEQGTLAICIGSNHLPGFEPLRQTYGRVDVDRDRLDGWFSGNPREILEKFGGKWGTTTFQAGDCIIFGMYTLHASTTNTTDRWRISCDVRFQPASEPADDRWIGENPTSHSGMLKAVRSIAQARAEWGI